MNNRNVNIDLIKSLACLGILGLHCIGYANYTIYYLCTFSVPLFFMVNGYLMFGHQEITFKYSLKKIWALLKIILLWNLILCIPVMVVKRKFVNPLEQIAKCLIQEGYLWHFWFFGALIVLYLFMPLIFKFVSNPKSGKIRHLCLCLIFLTLCVVNTVISCINRYPMGIVVPQSLRVWISMFYFLSGGLLARGIKKDCYIDLRILVPAVAIMAVVGNFGQKHLGLYIYQNRAAEYFYDEICVIIWCVLSFVLLLKVRIPEKFKAPIVSFSKLSLGIFIIHPLILKASEMFFAVQNTWQAGLLCAAVTVASTLTTLVISKIPFVKSLIELQHRP